MQDENTFVPSFGDWDYGTDIPYTTVFEKVRASKEGKSASAKENDKSSETSNRHMNESCTSTAPWYGNRINATSRLAFDERSAQDEWDPRKRASDFQSFSSRRSSLEQIADHIFVESQHAAGNESPVVSRQSSSKTWQRHHLVGSGGDLREPYVTDQYVSQSVLSQGHIVPNHHQGHQVMTSRIAPSHSVPHHHHYGHQVMGSTMQGAVGSPRKESLFPNDLYSAHQPAHVGGSIAEVPPTRQLPKFGDWNSIDPSGLEFTVIFDKARNERKCSVNQDVLPTKKVHSVADEDLYKPTIERRRSGLWSLFCCSCASM